MSAQTTTIASRLLNTSRSSALPELRSKSASIADDRHRSSFGGDGGHVNRPCGSRRRQREASRGDGDAARSDECELALAGVGDAGERHRLRRARPARTCARRRRCDTTRPPTSASSVAPVRGARGADDRRRQSGIDLRPRRAAVVAAVHVAAQAEGDHRRLRHRPRRRSCRCRGSSARGSAAPRASSFSTRPPSPAMNSSPAAGRIA